MINISIIIPVYNVDIDKIKKCVDSLLNQSRAYHDLIIVDDGSREEIANYIDDLCKEIPDARAIHTENKGVSSARNLGVKECSGNYIMFVDADDVVAENVLDEAWKVCSETGADIVYGFVKAVRNEKNTAKSDCRKIIKWKLIQDMDKQEFIMHLINLGNREYWIENMYVSRGPYSRLVKRELALLHPFKENIPLGEDAVWNIELAQNATKLALVYSLWYYYVYNGGSSTNKFRNNSVKEHEILIDELNYVLGQNYIYNVPLLEKKLDCVVEMIFQYYLYLLPKYGVFKTNLQFRKMLKKYGYLSCSIREFFLLRRKYKIKWIVFKYGIFPVNLYKMIVGFK